MKKRVRIITDVTMLALFLYQMRYHAGMGLLLHALLGIATFVLCIVHHILNLQWFKTLSKGRYNAKRTILSITDILLLLAMLLMMLSSFMISGLVFNISFLPVRYYWRTIHVASTAWCFMLIALHLGWHLHAPLNRLEKRLKQSVFEYVAYLIEALIVGWGLYGFVQSGLAFDCIMQPQSTAALPALLFYAVYVGMIAAVCIIIHRVLRLIDAVGVKQNEGR